MKSFFKYVLATVTGILLTSVLVVFILIGIIGAVINSGKKEATPVAQKSVLHIKLDQPIIERSLGKNFTFSGFGIPNAESKGLGLNDLVLAIKKAKNDANITSIYLDLNEYESTGFASSKEFRDALVDFKKSGKPIISYAEVYTNGSYYLASVANKVLLYPEGIIQFNGLSYQATFFKGMLDKIGIDVKLIRVGKYKSAGEPFIRKDLSNDNRQQLSEMMNSLFDTYLKDIAIDRKMDLAALRKIANDLKVQNPQQAISEKLIDKTVYPDELEAILKSVNGQKEKGKPELYAVSDYISTLTSKSNDNQIAVIYANGEIQSGEGSDEVIGSDRIANTVKKAREDKKIKAIVLRVNSPGGSALASDVIWREVVLARQVKPVIVSMGNLAASGGYYIAAPANVIFAQPNTITGSIGVFGMIPNAQKLLNEHIGITFDEVKTAQYADLGNITRPMSPQEEAIIQNSVNAIYSAFIEKVAKGRKMDTATVGNLAQGRVYTGEQALKLKLVDKIGGLESAIKEAGKLAKLSDYKIKELPIVIDPIEKMLSDIQARIQMGNGSLTEQMLLKKVKTIEQYSGRNNIQARTLFEMPTLD